MLGTGKGLQQMIRAPTVRLGAKADGARGWRRARIGEPAVAALALVLAALPLAVTALVVWAVLGRPLLFVQARAGLNARPFNIRKFRTMHESRDAAGTLLADELRLTPVTRLLRRMRLDELPQLWSILRGDMAFVGPRPLLPSTIQGFGELGGLRCAVRPGLTGWAQVSGNAQLSDAQKLALDIWYVDHQSRTLDFRILLETVAILLRGERIEPDRVAQAEAHLRARGGAHVTAIAG